MEGKHPVCEHGRGPAIYGCAGSKGGNFQRMFWQCPLPIGRQCKMFQWCAHQPHWEGPNQAIQAGRNPKSMEKSPSTSASRPPKPPTTRTSSSQVAPTTPSGEEETENSGPVQSSGSQVSTGNQRFQGEGVVHAVWQSPGGIEHAASRGDGRACGDSQGQEGQRKCIDELYGNEGEGGMQTTWRSSWNSRSSASGRRQQKKPDGPS